MQTVAPENAGFSSARLRRIDAAMQRLVDQGKIAGAVTLIARHGKVAHLGCFGLMDIEAKKPMLPDTIFRIASMTKPITAVATLILFEESHFLLDDPIADFLPEFKQTKVFAGETSEGMVLADPERPITIRHLLTHTSGLTYGNPSGTPVEQMYVQEQIGKPDEPLAIGVPRLAHLPLAHQPGAAWTYGLGLDVAGRLVEVVSGRRFDIFLKERIFDPLGMSDTCFHVPRQNLDRFAPVYTPGESGRLRRDDSAPQDRSEPIAFLSGGGGLRSTAADYARFAQMLLGGGEMDGARILGRKTVELMMANHLSRDKFTFPPPIYPFNEILPGQGFGLGGSVITDFGQFGTPKSVGSYQWGGAFSTSFWVDPKEDLIGLIMLQLTPLDIWLSRRFEVLAYQALVT